jgi:hypothetical protein
VRDDETVELVGQRTASGERRAGRHPRAATGSLDRPNQGEGVKKFTRATLPQAGDAMTTPSPSTRSSSCSPDPIGLLRLDARRRPVERRPFVSPGLKHRSLGTIPSRQARLCNQEIPDRPSGFVEVLRLTRRLL